MCGANQKDTARRERDACIQLNLFCVVAMGHAVGTQVSVLAGAQDPRVVSLCLVDPVDNTVYAPLAPGYPSAVRTLADSSGYAQPRVVRAGMLYESGKADDDDASWLNDAVGASHGETEIAGFLQDKYMRNVLVAETADDLRMAWSGASVPIAVVGAGRGADCAPVEANYTHFYDAAPGPKWQVRRTLPRSLLKPIRLPHRAQHQHHPCALLRHPLSAVYPSFVAYRSRGPSQMGAATAVSGALIAQCDLSTEYAERVG